MCTAECQCDRCGSEDCDIDTGRCTCKENVVGINCDRCAVSPPTSLLIDPCPLPTPVPVVLRSSHVSYKLCYVTQAL